MKRLVVITLFALTACGVDGPPIRPSVNTGVSVTPNGVSASTSVGVNLGGVSVHVGL